MHECAGRVSGRVRRLKSCVARPLSRPGRVAPGAASDDHDKIVEAARHESPTKKKGQRRRSHRRPAATSPVTRPDSATWHVCMGCSLDIISFDVSHLICGSCERAGWTNNSVTRGLLFLWGTTPQQRLVLWGELAGGGFGEAAADDGED